MFQPDETFVQDLFCSIIHIRQKLKTNLILTNRRMAEYILFTHTLKDDAGTKTNKLERDQIHSESSMRKSVFCKTMIKIDFICEMCVYVYMHIYGIIFIHIHIFIHIYTHI